MKKIHVVKLRQRKARVKIDKRLHAAKIHSYKSMFRGVK